MNNEQVVHGPEADQPFANAETPRELHNAVGEVDQLDALIGRYDDRLTVNRKAAGRRRSHPSTGLANGDVELAHEVLSVVGDTGNRDQVMLRKIQRQATRTAPGLYSIHNPTLTPAATEVGEKPTRSRHCKRGATLHQYPGPGLPLVRSVTGP